MGIPKRTQSFRDRAKEQVHDAQKDYDESYKSRDDRGFITGSIFDNDLLKEMGVEIWRPDVGEHVIDVIPFYAGKQHPQKEEGELFYKVDLYSHQRIGAMNDFFVCQALTWKVPDPMCTYMKANYIEDKKEYKAVKPSRRCAYLVWVHDNEEQEAKGIQIFEVAHWFFEKNVAGVARKPRGGGYVDWTNHDNGRHVYWTIAISGSYEDSSGTKRDSLAYDAFQLIQRETPKIPDDILAQSFALDEVIRMRPSLAEQNLAFFGTEEAPAITVKEGEVERLPKKTALERAREGKLKKESEKEDAVKELVEGLNCEVCSEEGVLSDVYDTDSGRVCQAGHGGIEGIEIPVEDEETPPEEKTSKTPPVEKKETKAPAKSPTSSPSVEHKQSTDLVCPSSELGGVFGETIEQMDACDDCEIWEECSDANAAGTTKTGTGKLVSR